MVATDSNVLVLYKVGNASTDNGPLYNAFYMPKGGGITLNNVKQHCRALRTQSLAGADGFHWRVRVDDKPTSSGGAKAPQFSWWDIQDENARLPIKEASQLELEHMFSASSSSFAESSGSTSNSASGAVRSLGKAVNKFASTVDTSSGGHRNNGPRISVVAFKLLDLAKTEERFAEKRQGGASTGRPRVRRQQQRREPPSPPLSPGQQTSYQPPAPAPQPRQAQTNYRRVNSTPAVPTPIPSRHVTPATVPNRQAAARRPTGSAPPARQREQSLMDFGNETPSTPRSLHHTTSSPAAFMASNNETRAERLKREYEQKKQKQNRVWDEVDQRWVTVDGSVKQGSVSAPPSAVATKRPKKKAVGIKLDAANTAGKSAGVQAAVNKRVNEMKESQQKALKEVREREAKKKQSEAEEDLVRRTLEPKIKAWSEEHGKKKQLRALLSSLHTVLWSGAKWKQVSLGDILDASKCKRVYHRATLVVHPDKTGHLDAEKRFLAKRIFDALSQAKTEFDNNA